VAVPVTASVVTPGSTHIALNGSSFDVHTSAVFTGNWEQGMYKVAQELLATDRTDVWDEMTRRFESHLIQAALASSKGRRIDAAHKLGIGRNTITRKIQELGLEKGVGKE
jgi:two-component system nitrogen regulation response regulator GlnG